MNGKLDDKLVGIFTIHFVFQLKVRKRFENEGKFQIKSNEMESLTFRMPPHSPTDPVFHLVQSMIIRQFFQ